MNDFKIGREGLVYTLHAQADTELFGQRFNNTVDASYDSESTNFSLAFRSDIEFNNIMGITGFGLGHPEAMCHVY